MSSSTPTGSRDGRARAASGQAGRWASPWATTSSARTRAIVRRQRAVRPGRAAFPRRLVLLRAAPEARVPPSAL
eukprot:1993238-Alexandrium_andersonii.AAC.1